MTAAKIAITLPQAHLARARAAVRTGRAASVSGYIVRALERQAREETLEALVRDLVAEHGQPSEEDQAWARRVLKRRKRR
jgi:Arc/MetJ-type ribon-helix-helix transcriptional regulator